MNRDLHDRYPERMVLAAVNTSDDRETLDSLDELQELADTAGVEVAGRIVQNRMNVSPGTYLGTGKIEELRELIDRTGADGVICDDELTPAQMRNLAELLDHKVVDRTMLILDIFASHANTSEGKIQVELAQLQYSLTMLGGLGKSLSRLGGGIGTRGPGEKKLETDRRRVRSRITRLKEELREVESHRDLLREGRKKKSLPVVAIVGYTNAGKSTLLNALSGSSVLEEDKLFATLDPSTRSVLLEDGQEVLFTDTVGFIRKLPHHLINAFRSTLEEARYADLILHVADVSNPQVDKQMFVVYDTLRQLGASDKPVITVYNKMDLVSDGFRGMFRETDQEKGRAGSTGIRDQGMPYLTDRKAEIVLPVSAREKAGLEELKEAVSRLLMRDHILIERLYRYRDEAGKPQLIRKYGRLVAEEYREDGIYIKAYVPQEIYGQV